MLSGAVDCDERVAVVVFPPCGKYGACLIREDLAPKTGHAPRIGVVHMTEEMIVSVLSDLTLQITGRSLAQRR